VESASGVREMGEEEIRQVGDAGPTIDPIEAQEFESNAELKEWLKQHAPAFLAVKRIAEHRTGLKCGGYFLAATSSR
jgi:hypothetical protein